MKEYILLPAYGRPYKSRVETEKDWNDGKDFRIFKGPYCSVRDMESMKKDVDKLVFIINTKGTIVRYNYWINPMALIVGTSYV